MEEKVLSQVRRDQLRFVDKVTVSYLTPATILSMSLSCREGVFKWIEKSKSVLREKKKFQISITEFLVTCSFDLLLCILEKPCFSEIVLPTLTMSIYMHYIHT